MRINIENQAITFDDVLLEPVYSEIESRTDVDLSTQLSRNVRIESPLIAANMDSISSINMAIALGKHGGVCPIHRFISIEEHVEAIQTLSHAGVSPIAATIGVNGDWEERLDAIMKVERLSTAAFTPGKKSKIDRAVNVVFIDIAHGHCKRMIEVLSKACVKYPDVDFIPGNVATKQAVLDLQSAGAAAIKVGIGPGATCSTRAATGCGVPQLTAIINCSEVADVPIIADGGIKTSGDIVKSLAAGASSVMIGALFAGTKEAAGSVMNVNGVKHKVFRGMASKDAQINWKGADPKKVAEEGVSTLVPYRGKVENVIVTLLNGVRSGYSYCGAINIDQLHKNAVFNLISTNTNLENSTRVF